FERKFIERQLIEDSQGLAHHGQQDATSTTSNQPSCFFSSIEHRARTGGGGGGEYDTSKTSGTNPQRTHLAQHHGSCSCDEDGAERELATGTGVPEADPRPECTVHSNEQPPGLR